jgi:hypothetical protein
MRRLVVILALCAAPAALAGTLLAAGGSPQARTAGPRDALQEVNFISSCRFSHMNSDDPIVYPRQPGKSHAHTFVGNTSTDAFSTTASLHAAGTTCQRPGDTAAYWMPTLVQDGKSIQPLGATIYYRARTRGRITPFPQGLKMIAGDARAMMPQSLRVTFWNCGVQAGVPRSSTVPTCPEGQGSSLRLHVTFPNCWDGRRLDSADHKSHMAYSENGVCPASHPVAVPSISFIMRYPISGGPDVELASMGQYSGHADFFNAWNAGALARLVDSCLNARRHCGRGI